MAGGQHVVNVTYNGGPRYTPKDLNNKIFTVKPNVDWMMNITVDEEPYGENTVITISTLPYHVDGKNVTVVIDGISYVVNLTNYVGTLTLNNLSAGVHDATVSYVGIAN